MKGIPAFFLPLCLIGCGWRFVSANESAGASPEGGIVFYYPEEPLVSDDAYAHYREEAARIAASLDDRLLAAQVILTGIDGNALSGGIKALLQSVPAGGIMLFRYNLNSSKEEVSSFLNDCSASVASVSGIAPFMAVDHEGGQVHRFGEGVARIPPAASFWEIARSEGRNAAIDAVETSALHSGMEISGLGITMNLAPVAEILDEENALFLQTRSYGPDAGFVRDAASAFIRGMDSAKVACVVKHFPGNSSADPHFSLPEIRGDKKVLDAMIAPFAGIIQEIRPSAIMVSHSLVPAVDPLHIASLSKPVLQGWLREELNFQGIIMADDFSMEAAASQGFSPSEAVIQALIAGADMVMVWPPDLNRVYQSLLAALEDKRLSRERLAEAAERILTEKLRYGIIPNNR